MIIDAFTVSAAIVAMVVVVTIVSLMRSYGTYKSDD